MRGKIGGSTSTIICVPKNVYRRHMGKMKGTTTRELKKRKIESAKKAESFDPTPRLKKTL